jgi:hypothetical protein
MADKSGNFLVVRSLLHTGNMAVKATEREFTAGQLIHGNYFSKNAKDAASNRCRTNRM